MTGLGRVKFSTAIVVAEVLKFVAGLGLLGTLAVAIAVAAEGGNTDVKVTAVATVLVAGLTSAALLATAGFGLEILVDSYSELADIRINTEITADNIGTDDDDDE